MAERALEMTCERAAARKTFGKRLLGHVSVAFSLPLMLFK